MQKTFDKLMPWGSRRRNLYQLGFSAIRIIREEGWRIFSYKARSKFKNTIASCFVDLYKNWINKYEPDKNALELQNQESFNFKYRPLISIVTPVWNPEPACLKSAIESVLRQTYTNWELCLADGGSTKPGIIQLLKEYAHKDSRIKVKLLEKNLGISGNSNQALSLVAGEFIVLLDHDDELAPFALYEVARVLNEKPDLDFIYSDEDNIKHKGGRLDPYFKPDWSPDLILSTMYTCHLGVFRKNIIDAIRGFRSDYDGSQDHDLVLRIIEKTSRIYHIPKVLYHWRIVEGSAAGEMNAKPYARIAGKKAIADYILRNNIAGEVIDGAMPGYYRLRRRIIGQPLVSIIIPSKNRVDLLRPCLDSIFEKTNYTNYQIIIVDNQSSDENLFEYYQTLKTSPKITILYYDQPFNFSAINNYAVTQSKGEHLLFLNNDTKVISGEWLSAMLEHSQRKEVGAVGAQLLYRNKSVQHCGIIIGLGGISGHHYAREFDLFKQGARPLLICNYSAVTGACLMMRKTVFNEIGGLDPGLSVSNNDIDLCLRIRNLNYLIVYTPYAQLYHYESLTRGYDDESSEKRLRFRKEVDFMRSRWGEVIDQGDPYYNPNLTLLKSDLSIKL